MIPLLRHITIVLVLSLCLSIHTGCSSLTNLFGLLGSDENSSDDSNPYEAYEAQQLAKKDAINQTKSEKQKKLQDEKIEKEKSSQTEIAPRKKQVLVLPFINKTGHGGDKLADFTTDRAKEYIGNYEDYETIDSKQLNFDFKILQSDNASFDLPKVFELAASRNIDVVVIGKIESVEYTQQGNEVGLFQSSYHIAKSKLFVQVFDIATEQAVLSKLESAESRDEFTTFFVERSPALDNIERAKTSIMSALRSVLRPLSKMSDQIAWSGKILKAVAPRYYINGGEKSGLRLGQLLKVTDEGYAILDRYKNKEVGRIPGRVKGILRIIDFIGEDGLIAVADAGGFFEEDDRVELYLPRKRGVTSTFDGSPE